MSLTGLKKQFNKANQYFSEKIFNAEGTKLDEDFKELEKKTDATSALVDQMINKTKEYLHPNPAARMKVFAQSSYQKVRRQAKTAKYPQPEDILGDCMIKGGTDLGDESNFGQGLTSVGESLKEMASYKDDLDVTVAQDFIEPLHQLLTKDIKEIMHHRKKLSGRRLDFDCKKRKQAGGKNITDEEIRIAEEKFDESYELSQSSMGNLLDNDVEQVQQLGSFVDALQEYHRQCFEKLQSLKSTLDVVLDSAQSAPRETRSVKKRGSTKQSKYDDSDDDDARGGARGGGDDDDIPSSPCARALYDFEPENEGELEFAEGQIIKLTSRLDENWLEGEVGGKSGYFPSNYVEVLVDVQ
ncbi:endophilin-A3-like [Oscarella lobularis]|uniref:endophilin-A3-like n=1 Tax=Oscarella lobularis TaxID=121494 RepID=UPI0033139A70